MANSPAPPLALRDGDRDELVSWTRSTAIRSGLAMRARIVLLASDGPANMAKGSGLDVNGTALYRQAQDFGTPLDRLKRLQASHDG